MNRKEKAKIVERILDSYFPAPIITLNYNNPYTLLIAVLLSAQCSDKAVNKVTPLLFQLANSAQQMANTPAYEVEKIIKPLGLAKTKAKNIILLSKKIMNEFQGQIPRTLTGLKSLPGVGHKTASVIISQAFLQPAFPVDTHIHRCAKRWGLSTGKNVAQTEKDLKKLFDKAKWSKLHLQMIYFGRAYCTARGHHIELCPICKEL